MRCRLIDRDAQHTGNEVIIKCPGKYLRPDHTPPTQVTAASNTDYVQRCIICHSGRKELWAITGRCELRKRKSQKVEVLVLVSFATRTTREFSAFNNEIIEWEET